MATTDWFSARKGLKIEPCNFSEMKLQLGERLELELLDSRDRSRHFTTLVGVIPNESLLVRTPVAKGITLPMGDNERVLIRLFSGTRAFAFETSVLRVCISPSHYLHLAIPLAIQCADIRSAIRIAAGFPATVRKAVDLAAGQPIGVTITNISIGGAHIAGEKDLGPVGSGLHMRFGFHLRPNNYEAHVETVATIQSVTPGDKGYEYGLRFEDLGSAQTILLQNFVYQLIVEEHKPMA
jgi:c-di-GMP-binding flagellar brake protein YcgR